jgi:hypothetical protein
VPQLIEPGATIASELLFTTPLGAGATAVEVREDGVADALLLAVQ